MEPILQVSRINKTFVKKKILGKSAKVKAVNDVSFDLNTGEVLVIAGESGSGKSTIARIILGSVKADSGSIRYKGKEVTGDKNMLHTIRQKCQMIHQDPYDSINPRMRIRDIVVEPLEIHRIGNAKLRNRRASEAIQDTKMDPDEVMTKYPHMLSGGQRQRIVLARALSVNPEIIIADEPVSMLDVSIRAEMLGLMQQLQQTRGISFIYITHDLATARYFGQRIIILYRGAIVETGPIDRVLHSPEHPYTKALISAISDPNPANRLRDRPVLEWNPDK